MAIIVNEANFEKETSQDLVLVDFYADWCGPCKMLAPVLDKLENVKVVKVNSDENQNLAVKYNVSALPTLILIKDGSEVGRFAGIKSQEEIQGMINENQ